MNVELLVIDFNNSSRIATCVNRETRENYSIKSIDKELQKGLPISVKSSLLATSRWPITLEAHEIEVGDFDRTVCWKSEDGVVSIKSWIGFSDNPDDLTYDRKIGFTDWFGPVDCSSFDFYAPGVFRVLVELNPDYPNSMCLLRVEKKFGKLKCDVTEFVEKMHEFEKKSKMGESKVRAIVLSFDEASHTAKCFSTSLDAMINIKLPLELPVTTGKIIRFTDYDYSDENQVYTPVSKPDSISVTEDDGVRLDGNRLLIESMIAFSVENNHPTYSKKKAYAGDFGHVKVEENIASRMERNHVYKAELTFNNSTELSTYGFKVWTICGDASPEESEAFMTSLYMYEDKNRVEPVEPENTSLPPMNEFSQLPSGHEPNQVNEDSERLQAAGDNRSMASSESSSMSSRSSQRNLGTSERSERLQFGRQIPQANFGTQNPTSSGQNMIPEDKEIENCAVVLDSSSREIFVYETTLLKLMKLENPNNERCAKWGVVRFIPEGSQNGTIFVKATSFRYSPPGADVIQTPDGPPNMKTHLVFSTNNGYKTFNRSCGFSNQFGLVEIAEPGDDFLGNTVYSTNIEIKQWTDPLEPVFRSVSKLEQENVIFSDDFANSMVQFEENLVKQIQANGLSASKMPQMDKIPSRPQKRNPNKPDRTSLPDWIKGLVVSVKKVGNRKWGRLLTPVGDAVFSEMPTHDSTGKHVQVLSWISVRITNVSGELWVTKIEREPHEYLDTSVDVRGNEIEVTTVLTSSSNFSTVDNINYYKHKPLGTVQTETNLDFGNGGIAHVVCRRGFGRPVPGKNGEECYWFARQIFPQSRSPERRSGASEYPSNGESSSNFYRTEPDSGWDNRQDNRQQPQDPYRNPEKNIYADHGAQNPYCNPEKNVYADHGSQDPYCNPEKNAFADHGSQDPFYNPEKNAFAGHGSQDPYRNPEKNTFAGHGSQDPYYNLEKNRLADEGSHYGQSSFTPTNGNQYDLRQNGFNNPNSYYGHSGPQSYQDHSRPMSQCQPQFPQPSPEQYRPQQPFGEDTMSSSGRHEGTPLNCLIVSRRKNIMLAYVFKYRTSAVIFWKSFKDIRVGDVFTCRLEEIPRSKETLNADFRITDIVEKRDVGLSILVSGSECYCNLPIDLSQPLTMYQDYSNRTGNFVLASGEVGSILLDNAARDVTGNTGAAAITDRYRGKPGSSDMVAQCQYTECLVPPAMLNRAGDHEDVFFAWKVIQVIGTNQSFEFNEAESKKRNLGPDAHELEEDDDISRQKRQAKLAYEASLRREQGMHSSASSNIGPFQSQPSGSQYANSERYGTPHGSRMFGSEQGFCTAPQSVNAGPSRSETPIAPSFDADPYQTSAVVNLAQSIKDRIASYTRDSNLAAHMEAVVPGNLVSLENEIENLLRMCQSSNRS
ncbi:hypothetical protein B9Z55_014571 [Caenorhabditis nigoni]|uniref:RSD-2 N-terminal domain-containing protein n=2 Tax=Caenorhabditis nigoni TaxID=1611254 RepID=A0A2G5U6I5_9PELO|nr:hypothetical protein B9Z55_014571 [Caenorhabditis nigoni]